MEQIPVPAQYQSGLEEMQGILQESAAENDEELLEKYFEVGSLTPDETLVGVRKGVLSGSIIPILAGSALFNKGIINLMNEIAFFLPVAAERPGLPATDLKTNEPVTVSCDEN